jgi:hypothetical protein
MPPINIPKWALAGASSALSAPLHSHQRVLAEQDRTFFRDLTRNRLRRGVFRDLKELIIAIGSYIDRHNEGPKPFIWTAQAADILEKVKPARRTLNKRQSA